MIKIRAKCFQVTHKTMALLILKTVKTKCYLPVSPRKNNFWKWKVFTDASNQITQFFQTSTTFSYFKVRELLIFLFHFFFFFFLKIAAKIIWFKSYEEVLEKYEFNIFLLIAASSFFSDLVTDIVYRKIVVMFFRYLVSFPLKLKIDHCNSILGPVAN